MTKKEKGIQKGNEIKALKGNEDLPFPIRQVSFFKNSLYVNNKTAVKIENAASYYQADRDITLKNNKGVEIGVITLTKENASILDPQTKRILLGALTEDQFVAYLTESDCGLSYSNFMWNYVVLHRNYADEYFKDYYKTAPIWGGISHPIEGLNLNSCYKKSVLEITANPKIKITEELYYENCIRAIQQPFAFERFLKLYHLLELNFDSLLVDKIKKIDLKIYSNKIGKLLNEYDQKEIKRLIFLLKEKCHHPSKFIPHLDILRNYEIITTNLFYVFGTAENPIKKESSYLIISRSCFFGDAQNLRSNAVSIDTDRTLDIFLIQFVAYVIYRIRCSIAHNKIGEFIFKPKDDEKFIVEFAEPLLKEVLVQCFKK